jgi:outer membrane protein OmpA-like peptidoglycan-associated protein
MYKSFLIGAVLTSALPLLAGCATKDFVRKTTEARMVPAEQRLETVERGLQASDDAARTAIDQTKAAIAEQTAAIAENKSAIAESKSAIAESKEAIAETRTRADKAMTRADEVDTRLTRLWTNRNQRNQVDTLNVQFGFDKSELDDRAQTALANLVKELKENPKLGVELQGYADPVGPGPYNVQLSNRRVEAVRRYLVGQGIELPRIHSIGLGPIAGGGPNADKRRVTLRVTTDKD